MQRRLISALEDLKLTSDGTVKNTAGTIVQFLYGEDGVDPAKAVRSKAIDMNDLFFEVFGDDYENPLHEERDVGGDYGSLEKDELESIEEDESEDSDNDMDYDYDGGGE